jgi:hypothetical protein
MFSYRTRCDDWESLLILRVAWHQCCRNTCGAIENCSAIRAAVDEVPALAVPDLHSPDRTEVGLVLRKNDAEFASRQRDSKPLPIVANLSSPSELLL